MFRTSKILPSGPGNRLGLVRVIVFLFLFSGFFLPDALVWAGGYVDPHNDRALTGWKVDGGRSWSENDSVALPQDNTGEQGFLINNYECTSDGIFCVTLRRTSGGANNIHNGGIVFRFTNQTNYYFVAIKEGWTDGQSDQNEMRLFTNTTDYSDIESSQLIKNNLNFKDNNGIYNIKVKLSGSVFTFWLNGDSLGQVTSDVHPSGQVGYAYHSTWNNYVMYDSSSWEDDAAGAPVIRIDTPHDTTVGEGATVNFRLSVNGLKPLTYAWYKKGEVDPVSSDSILTLSKVSTADDGSYFCIVFNELGSDTSREASLTVVKKPEFTTHPSDTTIYIGDTAVFSVVASGGGLSYSWLSGSTPISGTAPTLKVVGTSTNNNTSYRCVVKNLAGPDTSEPAVLTVIDPKPKITVEPQDTTVFEGNPVSFVVEATGKPPLVYTWYQTGSTLSIGNGSVLTFPRALLEHDGTSYYCKVSNGSGDTTSRSAILNVNDALAPVIISEPTDMVARETQSVTFKITVSGSQPFIFEWFKNGVPGALSNEATLTLNNLTMADAGNYYCKVTNFMGEATSRLINLQVKAIDEVYNPIIISGQFYDRTHISLTIQNFRDLPSEPGTLPFVDTVGIWYKSGASTLIPDRNSLNLVKIPLSSMLAGASDSYTEIIALNPGPEECFDYYFSGSVFWHNPDSIPPFTLSSGFSTHMCSGTPIANELFLTPEYVAGGDSVVLHITNIGSLNRDSLMYLVVWYGNDELGYTYDTIPPGSLPPEPAVEVVRTYRGAMFTGEAKDITFNVAIRGILGNQSDPVSRVLNVGVPRPENNAVLTVGTISPTQVELSWAIPPMDLIDSVKIWWGNEKIPLKHEIDENKFSSRSFPAIQESTVITGLTQLTNYYFGLQVHRNGLWSAVTELASAAVRTTVIVDTTQIPNRINITGLNFDGNSNTIVLEWTIDTIGIGNLTLETGITWHTSTYPKNEPSSSFGQIVSGVGVENTHTLDLGMNLTFDTLYYFVMWMRKVDGLWAAPTDSSKDTVRIPPAVWQKITYFKNTDTLRTFNQKIMLWKSATWSAGAGPFDDTLDVITPVSIPEGLIPVSPCLDFRYDRQSPPLYFGMRPDSVPAGYSLKDIWLYNYNVETGKWKSVAKEGVDSVNQVVYSYLKQMKDYPDPFMLMIDTREPAVNLGPDSTAVQPLTNLPIPLTVNDNISNIRVELWASNGANKMSIVSSDIATDTAYSEILVIPADLITTDNGVRAELVISDGRFTRKINISRSVRRGSSDEVVTEPESWIPLAPTAVLDDPSVETVLDELKGDDGWTYDPVHFLLYRWVTHNGNINDTVKWVEYSSAPEIKQLFDFTPGRVLWIKTRDRVAIDLGPGYTTSLKETCNIELNAKDWTDIALPFMFNVRIGDILDATGLEGPDRDSIWFYSWKTNEETERLYSSPLHLPPIPDMNLPGSDLEYGYARAFTVYNNLERNVVLKIPPTPVSMSTFPAAKKSAASGWSVAVKARTAEGTLSPVYFAYSPGTGTSFLPASPSFSSVALRALDKDNNRLRGHMIAHEMSDGGIAFPLVFENSGTGSQKIVSYSLERGKTVPEQIKTAIFNPGSMEFDKSGKVTLSAGGREYRYVLAGDDEFISGWKESFSPVRFSIVKIYPNPLRGVLNIGFTTPYSGVKTVMIRIYDQLGRTVWSRELGKELRPGFNSIKWNPASDKLATGTYVLQLTAFSPSGKVTGTAQSRIMYIK